MFVVAPGPVVVFVPKLKSLLADLPRIPSDEREGASYFTVDGEVLRLTSDERRFFLIRTGVFDKESLQSALAAIANDAENETEPPVVARQVIRGRRGRWLPWRSR